MKKLKKVKTTLQDSIEAYAGICDCMSKCPCNCDPSIETQADVSYATLESNSLSISLSHYNWA